VALERYIEYRQETIKTFVIPTVSAGLMGIFVYFIYKGFRVLTGSNTLATLISLLLAIIIYFTLVIFLKGIEEEELRSLPKGDLIIGILQRVNILKN
jgi:stage V sporulation protein B